MADLFLGVDAGGSSTRAILATADGGVVGVGRAEGANIWSSGTAIPDTVGRAIGDALRGSDPQRVARAVIGVAGILTADEVAAEIAAMWGRLGLPGSPDIVPDVLVAFASGTVAADGVVLVAGTGSIAAAIRDREVRRRAGGYGWLLGDEGSAVWLGVQAIRLALTTLDGRGASTVLARTIPEALGIAESAAASAPLVLVRSVHERPPAHLGRLAPVVLDAASGGDPVAQAIVDEGVAKLLGLLTVLIDAAAERPVIVLAGSLVTKAPLIAEPLRARIGDRWPGALISTTTSGEAGAATLAIGRSTGTPVPETTLARLRDEAAAAGDA